MSAGQLEMDLTAGLEARDGGMAAAIAHAGESWSDRAHALFGHYIRQHKDDFLTEDARLWAHRDNGLELPPDSRAWGSVVVWYAKAGMIHRVGFAPMKSRNCHANPKAVWRVGAAA